MKTKQTIKEVIVVEGHSDTAKLKSLLDCETIETGGSSLDEKTLDLIARVNRERGIIIFTDPDYPGMQIRHKIEERIGSCKHAFVAKQEAIAHGKVGIAEARPEAILQALEQAVSLEEREPSLSWEEFVAADIIGHKDRRLYVYAHFGLGYGNVKTLFKRLNMMGIDAQQLNQALEEAV